MPRKEEQVFPVAQFAFLRLFYRLLDFPRAYRCKPLDLRLQGVRISPPMPSKKPEREFRVGEKVRVNLHAGKIVDATIRAVIPQTGGEWAKDAGVDENDPLLLRALEAQQKAIYPVADPSNWRTNWASWLDMQEAIYDFMEAHLKIKQGWHPNEDEIELSLPKIEGGKATATAIEGFQRLADETLREWEPQYWPDFKVRIEAALRLLDPPTGENMERK